MGKKETPAVHQPKSVRLATYTQSVVIAILLSGVMSWVASYFVTINMYADTRQSVLADIKAVSKTEQ